jgi:hypothetical protein
MISPLFMELVFQKRRHHAATFVNRNLNYLYFQQSPAEIRRKAQLRDQEEKEEVSV